METTWQRVDPIDLESCQCEVSEILLRKRKNPMIIDHISNMRFYEGLGSGVAEALAYLAQTDLSKLPNGKYELDGDRLFVIIQRYRPKPFSDIAWEAHRNYIDVQYVARGTERMGYTPLHDNLTVKQDFDPQRDVIFYEAQGDLVTVPEGGFAIFTPHDVHAPSLANDPAISAGEVLKAVVKCRWESTVAVQKHLRTEQKHR